MVDDKHQGQEGLIKEILLHVGLHKTASTSIQWTLAQEQNRLLLEQLGIHYPNSWPSNHSDPLSTLFADNPQDLIFHVLRGYSVEDIERERESFITQFLEEIRVTKARRLLLSGEGVSHLNRSGLVRLREFLKAVAAPDVTIRVIVYVRNPLDMSISMIQQQSRTGMLTAASSILRHQEKVKDHFRGDLGKMAAVFGDKALEVYAFEEAKAYPGGPVAHFLHIIGLSQEDIGAMNILRANERISKIASSLIAHINGQIPILLDGRLNPQRSAHDTHPLFEIQGPRFDIPYQDKLVIQQNAKEDVQWLKAYAGIDYSTWPKPEEKEEPVVYDEIIANSVVQAVARMDSALQKLVLDYYGSMKDAGGVNTELQIIGRLYDQLQQLVLEKAVTGSNQERLPTAHIQHSGWISMFERMKKRRIAWQLRQCACLDPIWYLEQNPDVAYAGIDPRKHFIKHGLWEGRTPNPDFDAKMYAVHNPDIQNSANTPLMHYALHGYAEGRTSNKSWSGLGTKDNQRIKVVWVDNNISDRENRELAKEQIRFIRDAGYSVLRITPSSLSRVSEQVQKPDMVIVEEGDISTKEAKCLHVWKKRGVVVILRGQQSMSADGASTFLDWSIGYDPVEWQSALARYKMQKTHFPPGQLRMGYVSLGKPEKLGSAGAWTAATKIAHEEPHCKLLIWGKYDLLESADAKGLIESDAWIQLHEMTVFDDLAKAGFDVLLYEETGQEDELLAEIILKAALMSIPVFCANSVNELCLASCSGMTTTEDWYDNLKSSIFHASVWNDLKRNVLFQVFRGRTLEGNRENFLRTLRMLAEKPAPYEIDVFHGDPERADYDVLWQWETDRLADVAIVVPCYNYANYIEEALDSVAQQSLTNLELIVVDDASTDESVAVVQAWMERHHTRFTKVLHLRHHHNAGLSKTRNAGFYESEASNVFLLDADNVLTWDCLRLLHETITAKKASVVYPTLRHFGLEEKLVPAPQWSVERFRHGNYIDAMALIRKSLWWKVGGYQGMLYGWEDYDFWCHMVEAGMQGMPQAQAIALYRVHHQSLTRTKTLAAGNHEKVVAMMRERHPWLLL